jgi:putative ABC transport system permease protein
LVSKNLSRRKGRAIASSIGLILAIAVIVSTLTVTGAMQTKIGIELEKYGLSIVVIPNSEKVAIPYGSVVIGDNLLDENSIDKIYAIADSENIRVLSPKLYNQINYGNNSILVVGLFPETEIQLKTWWNVTGSLPQNNTAEILLGSELKAALGAHIGSFILLGNSSFVVTGILDQTGSIDDYSIFMPLNVSQKLFNREGKISEINVGVTNGKLIDDISKQIMEAIPNAKAIPITQAKGTRTLAVQQTANFSLLLASIILVVGIGGIMNTTQSSVNQRMGEIGVLLSLGADNSHLYKLFLSEAAIIGLIGGIVGTAIGIATSLLLGPLLINTPISIVEMPLFVIPLAIGLSVATSVGASLYPTWIASKIDPVKALKAI